MRVLLSALILASCLYACSDNRQRLSGVWKGSYHASANAKPSLTDALAPVFVSNLQLEFNPNGRFKESVSLGSGEGNYSVSGNEVLLTPDAQESKSDTFHINKQTLVFDGDTLRVKKDFPSDPDIVFTRENSAKP